ncbi:MAG: acyl-CoA thioesterase [Pirellulaceae bacterium]
MTHHKTLPALKEYPVAIAIPVQWGDQDAFGHVNNTVPIRWFESARIAYLEQSGMGHLMNVSGLGPILAAISCSYRRQIHFPDTVHIGARVSQIGKTSMMMEHVVYSERLSEVAAEGTSTVVMFDYAVNKPKRMPEDIRAAIERLEGKPLNHPRS